MNSRKFASIIASILLISIIYALTITPNNEIDYSGVEFNGMLDLTDDEATTLSVGSYLINRDNEPGEYSMISIKALEEQRISIELGAIMNSSEVISLRNQTELDGLVRQFEVEILDDDGNKVEEVHGWIDQRKNVFVSFAINWYSSFGPGHGGPWIPSQDNATIEAGPIIDATNLIISRVGLQYFERYFHDPAVETPKYNPNITLVTYKYDIEIDEQTIEKDVSIYFYQNFTQVYGLPVESNYQPFTLSAEEAKKKAVDAGLPAGPYELETDIIYMWIEDVLPAKGYGEKYIWRVVSWESPPWASPRKRQSAYVDPHSGQVYSINQGGRSLQEGDVDTLEEAQSHGLEGYVKLHYPELPKTLNLTNSEDISFQLQISFISHVEDLTEVKVTVDPYNLDTYWIQSNTGDLLREYLSYEPNGGMVIGAGETVNITCTLHMPVSEQGFSFNKRSLRGLGIGTENILIVHDIDD